MHRRFGLAGPTLFLALAIAGHASATSIPRVSFEELTDSSDVIAAGRIARSWPEWDANHRYIWTHYQLSVSSVQKGVPGGTIEFAEPGGTLEGVTLSIPGAVAYQTGEKVLVFLQRMPNGYLRTTGWGQGRYQVDGGGRLHGDATLSGAEIVDSGTRRPAATPVKTLEGMSLQDVAVRVSARTRAGMAKPR